MACSVRHTVPVNDLHEHSLECVAHNLPLGDYVECKCECLPRRIISENGVTIFAHRAYDGREAMEETSAILNTFYRSEGWLVYLQSVEYS